MSNKPVRPLHLRRAAIELIEIPKHDHDYYRMSKKVNDAAWRFLVAHTRPVSVR